MQKWKAGPEFSELHPEAGVEDANLKAGCEDANPKAVGEKWPDVKLELKLPNLKPELKPELKLPNLKL